MFLEESLWIKSFLVKRCLSKGRVLIDVGSSDEKLRCLDLPFVDYYIFRPLRTLGVTIIHVDQRAGEGVDVVCDVADKNSAVLENMPPADVVLCTSLLEHVANRSLVVERIKALVKTGGYLIITVPYRYKYHPDPIDTLYRPSNKELEAFFNTDEYAVVESMILEVEGEPVVIAKGLSMRVTYKIMRTLFPKLASTCASCFAPMIIKNKVSILVVQKK